MRRHLTREDVEIKIECLEEDLDPEGQFASGDATVDAEMIAQIRSDREWNPWAWCCVRVVMRYEDREETDYLGCCSYTDEADFRSGGYFDDMVDGLLARFNAAAPVYVPQRDAFLESFP